MAMQADGHLPEPRVANFARWLVLVMETNPTTLLDYPLVTSDDIRRKQRRLAILIHTCCAKIFSHQLGPPTFLATWCYLVVSAQWKDSSGFVSGIGCSKVGVLLLER